MTNHLSSEQTAPTPWVCAAHNVTTTRRRGLPSGDCPKCDNALIALHQDTVTKEGAAFLTTTPETDQYDAYEAGVQMGLHLATTERTASWDRGAGRP